MLTILLLAAALQSPPPELRSRAQALSPDGKLFAYSVSDGTVHIASLPEGKSVRVLAGLPSVIDGLAFSPDGTLLASIADDGTIRTFRPAGDDAPRTIEAGGRLAATQRTSRLIEFVDSGTKLLVIGGTERTRLLDASSGKSVREWTLAEESKSGALSPLTASAMSDDGMHLAMGDDMGRLAVFSASTGAIEAGPWQVPLSVNALAFDKSAHRLAVGAGDCKVRILSLAEKKETLELSHCDADLTGDLAIGCVCFSADGKSLLASSFSFWEVRLWDLETRKQRWAFDYGGGNEGSVGVGFSEDAQHVYVGPLGTILDAANGKQLRALGTGSPCVENAQYGFAGEYVFHSSKGAIDVHDARDRKLVCELPLGSGK